MSIVLGIPVSILNLVQQGLLERAFHDGLFPKCMYRAEASEEEWGTHGGTEIFMTRPGLMAPVTKPLRAGEDPTPQALTFEQWIARLERYGNSIDIHVPTSTVSNADRVLRDIHQLGLNAGQSLNRIPRNALFRAYCSGHTVSVDAAGAAATQVHVASVNGFREVVLPGSTVRPAGVSAATPLPVQIAGIGVRNVIGIVLDNADDEYGPGWLVLDAALGGAGILPRTPVLSSQRPLIMRSGGGNSVDAIGAGDTLVLQDIITAVNKLRKNSVPPHEDGTYHCHFDTDGNSQIFADPAYQNLQSGNRDNADFAEAYVGRISGCDTFLNPEAPDWTNSGARTATGNNAMYSEDIGAETTNESGVNIGRVIVTGRGALIEKYLDESAYVTEAGVTGKVGEFQVVNAGVEVQTKHVRLILRAPLNRLQDQIAATWSISTSFATPSDVTAGGSELYKRAVVIEHAID